MKKVFVWGLFLCGVWVQEGWASRARIMVLGAGDSGAYLKPTGGTGLTLSNDGDMGSLSYDDPYNIFYNPSYILDHPNWAIVEKSNYPGGTAQGGFSMKILKYSAGLFFNRPASMGLQPNSEHMRPVEFFAAADLGFKLGMTIKHGVYTRDDNNDLFGDGTDRDITLGFGAQINEFHPFLSAKVFGKRSGGQAHQQFLGGLRYLLGEWVPYVAGRYNRVKGKTNNQLSTREFVFGLGMGRETLITSGVRLFTSLSFWRVDRKLFGSGALQHRRNVVPFELGVEGDASDWATLRAGLSHRIVDSVNGIHPSENTTGRVGTTLRLGQASFNWAVGSNPFFTGETSGQADLQDFSLSTGFFTAASLEYTW